MITINRNSWHYRMAKLGSNYGPSGTLCPYVREVFLGMFLFSLIVFLLGLFAIMNILGIVAAFQGIWSTDIVFPIVNLCSLALAFFITLSILWSEYGYKVRAWQYERKGQSKAVPNTPSFVALWWRSVHDKLCPYLDFK